MTPVSFSNTGENLKEKRSGTHLLLLLKKGHMLMNFNSLEMEEISNNCFILLIGLNPERRKDFQGHTEIQG